MTTSNAIKAIWPHLPNQFHEYTLMESVRPYLDQPHEYGETVLRKMRKCKRMEVRLVNRNKSLYQKVNPEVLF